MIYALNADTSHIEKEDVFDATIIEFDGFERAMFFDPDIDYHQLCGAPPVMEFLGDLKNLAWLDHVFTSPLNLLLVSKRMMRVLESVGSFRHRAIPTVIYSSKVKKLVYTGYPRRRTSYQVQDPSLRNDDFVILQLAERLDCLDHDRTLVSGTSFRESGETYLGVEDAQHFEFRKPEGGFPPVFFVPGLVFYCFSEEAKRACEHAGLKGLWWRPLP
ncbi:hypothetical protein [Cystobacter ferrugineus]|uniref:hypothetical protein n=1 Tax=Cystobacter ferrugineus TaxID=83449 RepID=UPI000AA15D6B|nr:hypothetical protein [Cystobacter ferrugineus]